jgi:predicted PurR-regulated permease PerM
MKDAFKLPTFVKIVLLLVGLYIVFTGLAELKSLLLPIIYAILISILISPLVNFLVNKKFNRTLAVALVMLVFLLVSASIVLLLASQINRLSQSWPQLSDKFNQLIDQVIFQTSSYLNISTKEIEGWISEEKSKLLENSRSVIGGTLISVGNLLATAVLVPVYTFMILNYEPHLVAFIHKLFGILDEKNVTEVLTRIKSIIRKYVVGLSAEIAIIAVLNSIGLLIVGLEYAILLGTLGAFLNVIPYFGGLVAVTVFSLVALITKPPIYILYVVGCYMIIQFIDNNLLVPKIVGGNVKLNPLICILAVISGATLWGIPGMFLSIPIAAIMRLIFDRIDSLKPWGFLMGDTPKADAKSSE